MRRGILRISKDFILREIAEDYIVVPTGRAVFQFMGLITVNEVGAFLWKALQKQECTLEELTEMVCQEYEVGKEIAEQDVAEFIELLENRCILQYE